MSIDIVNTLPDQVWQHFLDRQPNSNIFHTPEMFRVFAQTPNYDPALWAATDGDAQVLALFVPVRISLFPLFGALTTRAVSYGSILYEPGPRGLNALRLLLDAYRQSIGRSCLFTELRNLSDLTEAQPVLEESGFVYEDHLDYLLDLERSPDEILESIKSRTRKQIRRALRLEAVQVHETTTPADLEQWYATLQHTYRHAGVPLAPRALFDACFQQLVHKGMARFLTAAVDGQIAACSLELMHKDTMYGWYGGMNRQFSKHNPNELLIWHILRWGTQNNYRVYDFGGAGQPNVEYGVRDFKAKFGGKLVCYGRNTLVHAPRLLNLSQAGYHFYQRFGRAIQQIMTRRE